MGLLAVPVLAQTPNFIGIIKLDEYSQLNADSLQPGASDLAADVTFASAVPASTTVSLQGHGQLVVLQLQSDGSYQALQQYNSRAALDAAFPDGTYTVSVSGRGPASTTTFAVAFGSAIPGILVTNFTALQAWQNVYPTFSWQPIPGAAAADVLSVGISNSAGADLMSSSPPGNATGTYLSGPLPIGVLLTCDLTYARDSYSYANGGATGIAMGSGFNVEFTFECAPMAPVFLLQPASVVLQVGATATISANATYNTNDPTSYQWYKNGVAIPGAVLSIYTISNTKVSDAGTSYTVQATNEGGTTVSSSAVVAVSGSLYLSPYAGQPGVAGNADGPAAMATFGQPSVIAVDSLENIYVGDFGNHTVRKITHAGIVSTIAGMAGQRGSVDGLGSAARFIGPDAITVDTAGNIYVADGFDAIRKIDPTGMVTTLAGGTIGANDGVGIAAQFSFPTGLATDAVGNIYVADSQSNRIRKVTPSGVVTTLAGSQTVGTGDGVGSAAQFYQPRAVACDAAGDVYVADCSNARIRKITPSGSVTTIAGYSLNGGPGRGGTDGLVGSATFDHPGSIGLDPSGNIYVGDYNGLREITTQGIVVTLVGGASGSGNQMYRWGLFAISSSGSIYVADSADSLVLKAAPIAGSTNPELTFVQQPQSETVAMGSSVLLSVSVAGPLPTYQWMKNGVPISGATSAQYFLTGTSGADTASYSVQVGNGIGSVVSNPAVLTETTTTDPGRLSNLSTLAVAGSGSQTLTVGFFTGGAGTTGSQPLLIHALGPVLSTLSVPNVMPDPQLKVFSGQTTVGSNSGWGTPLSNQVAVIAADKATYATALSDATSKDSATVLPFVPGGYTIQVSSASGVTGKTLVAFYDDTPSGAYAAATPRQEIFMSLDVAAA